MLRKNFPGNKNGRRLIVLDNLKRQQSKKIMSPEFIKRSNMDVKATHKYFERIANEIKTLEVVIQSTKTYE